MSSEGDKSVQGIIDGCRVAVTGAGAGPVFARFAAAPDMAEALRKGLYALASELYGRSVADRLVTSLVWPNDAPECVNIVCEDMRAALSKAHGETP